MNLQFCYQYQPEDPRTSLELLRCLQYVNGPTPVASILQRFGPANPVDPSVVFFVGNEAVPNCVMAYTSASLLILIGGATDRTQITHFLRSIESGPSNADPLLSVSYLYNAAQILRTNALLPGGYSGKHVYIAGHSLGGAVAEVLGATLLTRYDPLSVNIWSYGSPRPGPTTLARRLATMSNTRVVVDGDIVPRLPPHIDEVPATAVVSSVSLWRGCNTLVQAPECYVVDFQGRWSATAAFPPANWAFTLDLINYVCNVMVGGAGPNHAVGQYFAYTQLAANLVSGAVPRPAQPVESPLTPRPRERDAIIAIGRAEIFSDATSPTGETRTYAPPPVIDPAAPRYKAARDGRAWVIKLAGQIVGAATGKRNAKHIARQWNRSARATLK